MAIDKAIEESDENNADWETIRKMIIKIVEQSIDLKRSRNV